MEIKLRDNEILYKIAAYDEKDYYIYSPGTFHMEERFGKKYKVQDIIYLDEHLNKYICAYSPMYDEKTNTEYDVRYKKMKDENRDIFIGAPAPEIEDENGEFVPNKDMSKLGIWERPTDEEINLFSYLLNRNMNKKLIKKNN